MTKLYMIIVIFLIGFTLTNEALAMRCSGKLVRVGDSSYKMLKHCGKPLQVVQSIYGDRQVFVYEMNGREQRISVVNGIIRDGV